MDALDLDIERIQSACDEFGVILRTVDGDLHVPVLDRDAIVVFSIDSCSFHRFCFDFTS